jgi:hypothetical protein
VREAHSFWKIVAPEMGFEDAAQDNQGQGTLLCRHSSFVKSGTKSRDPGIKHEKETKAIVSVNR